MTPDALRAAIASARLRPRMYGATPMHAAAYMHGMIAGAAPDGAAVNAAWLDAYAAADPLHPTDAEVCDAAEATVAALWPQGDDAPALDLDAIEARAAAADPGPWRSTWPDASDPNSLDEPVVESLAPGLSYAERMVVGTFWYDGPHAACGEANAAFIAAARSDVPALVAALREARAEVRRLRAEVEAAEVDALKAQAAAAEPVLMLDAIRRGACVPGLCAACDAPWVDDADHNCAACGNPEGERRWDAATNAVLAYIEREQTKRYGRGSQPIAVVRADGDYFTAIYRHTADGLREPWQTARFRTPADAARRLASMLSVDLAVIDAAAEGEAFVDAHPYAAGAILGGIAHRSEGGDRGA